MQKKKMPEKIPNQATGEKSILMKEENQAKEQKYIEQIQQMQKAQARNQKAKEILSQQEKAQIQENKFYLGLLSSLAKIL